MLSPSRRTSLAVAAIVLVGTVRAAIALWASAIGHTHGDARRGETPARRQGPGGRAGRRPHAGAVFGRAHRGRGQLAAGEDPRRRQPGPAPRGTSRQDAADALRRGHGQPPGRVAPGPAGRSGGRQRPRRDPGMDAQRPGARGPRVGSLADDRRPGELPLPRISADRAGAGRPEPTSSSSPFT